MHRSIYILWDASHIWGLMALHTLQGMGVTHRIITCNEITHGALSGKPSLLVVPGGTASLKYQALGKKGVAAIQDYVANGGNYLGFCGGAGLGLSHGHGLHLCPWKRASYTDRTQHLVSGHVLSAVHQHSLAPAQENISLPIWWPARFAPEENKEVTVLAKYTAPGHDFYFADIDLHALPHGILEQWQDMYGVDMGAAFLEGKPCVITGNYGKGRYVLSYSHLETPASPEANTWLAALLQELGNVKPSQNISPPWHVEKIPDAWAYTSDTALLFRARDGLRKLLHLGVEHHLLFPRTPWLYGWRTGIPGGGLNNLYTALCTILGCIPNEAALCYWKSIEQDMQRILPIFLQGVENYLLAERLATTLAVPMPHVMDRRFLHDQQKNLFGTVMHSGGAHKELLTMADRLLYLLMKK